MNKKESMKYAIMDAKEFYTIAAIYYKSRNIEEFCYHPFITNISFSCELLLKIMLYLLGNKIKDITNKQHNLYDLFYMLPLNAQLTIKNELISYRFERELKRGANIFVQIRYGSLDILFGRNSKYEIDPTFLKKFCESLINYIDSLNIKK